MSVCTISGVTEMVLDFGDLRKQSLLLILVVAVDVQDMKYILCLLCILTSLFYMYI